MEILLGDRVTEFTAGFLQGEQALLQIVENFTGTEEFEFATSAAE